MERCADITRQHTVTLSWDVCVLTVLAHVGFVVGWGVFCFVSFVETRSKVASTH